MRGFLFLIPLIAAPQYIRSEDSDQSSAAPFCERYRDTPLFTSETGPQLKDIKVASTGSEDEISERLSVASALGAWVNMQTTAWGWNETTIQEQFPQSSLAAPQKPCQSDIAVRLQGSELIGDGKYHDYYWQHTPDEKDWASNRYDGPVLWPSILARAMSEYKDLHYNETEANSLEDTAERAKAAPLLGVALETYMALFGHTGVFALPTVLALGPETRISKVIGILEFSEVAPVVAYIGEKPRNAAQPPLKHRGTYMVQKVIANEEKTSASLEIWNPLDGATHRIDDASILLQDASSALVMLEAHIFAVAMTYTGTSS